MNRDEQPYFAPNTEHEFDSNGKDSNNNNDSNDKIDKMLKNLNVELEKGVKEEAREKIKKRIYRVMSTLAREMQKEYDEKIEKIEQEFNKRISTFSEKLEQEYDRKKEQEKKNCWIVVSVFFGWMIIVAILIKYFFNTIKFASTEFLGVLGSVLGSVLGFIFASHSEIAQKVAHMRDDKESYSTGIVNSAKALAEALKKASLLHLVILACVATFFGVSLESTGIFERIYRFVDAAYTVVMTEDENVFSEVRVDKEIMTATTAGHNEKTIGMLQQGDIPQAELELVNELSQQDRDWVFNLNRKDIDWTDQDEVNTAVLQMVDEIISMKMENVFDMDVNDGGAPQWLRDLIAQASEDEITAETFSDIKAICDVRADVYNLYPKESLAKLLSNNYQKMAIILWLHGGEECSIVYYYSKSILMDIECLQFAQNSNTTIKDKLYSIARRYMDMIYTCPHMENLENVRALAEAFENAAEQYYGRCKI